MEKIISDFGVIYYCINFVIVQSYKSDSSKSIEAFWLFEVSKVFFIFQFSARFLMLGPDLGLLLTRWDVKACKLKQNLLTLFTSLKKRKG